ncbi:cupredoxin domain-containing protein [Sulfurirhabdus autotrophica]|uniref:Cupredoxin-like protein n=1 Tax=Sulfurirhabdus autotrophica TaxID=1706046 RepID=A0A4R3XRK1_9PROT|nr:cupredoxin domain-containing protein [Sulfurirhabdus autotrophica]TCV79190.1 cupredoxin-like protein [Sulfurirhabdus autotrophica]
MNKITTNPGGLYSLSNQLRDHAVGYLVLTTLVAVVFLLVPAKASASDLLTYTVTAKDGQLVPNTLNVPAGVRFKIVVRNQGRDAIEFESLQLRKEKVLAPGAESFVVIAPLKPGKYEFFDEFHPDTSRGHIIVK